MTAEITVSAGLSMVCRTCTKYHRGRDLGLETCTAQDGCGSPIVADTFHEYEGPITDFLKFCFVCGKDSQKALAVRGHSRRIGVCLDHLDYVVRMQPNAPKRGLPVLPRTYTSNGQEEAVEKLIIKPKYKLLSDLFSKAEKGDTPGEDG